MLAACGENDVSYARCTSTRRRSSTRRQRRLSAFGDDSSNYLWKLYAARAIMRLYRHDRAELIRLELLQTAKNSAEEVLHPASSTPRFATPAALREAWEDGEIRAFADDRTTGLARHPSMGELAARVGAVRGLYRGLRPEALAVALYIGAQTRAYAGGDSPLGGDLDGPRRAVPGRSARQRRGDAQVLPAHDRLGVRRRPQLPLRSPGARLPVRARRLQVLNAIAWVREPGAIHVTVAARRRLAAAAARAARGRLGLGGLAPAADSAITVSAAGALAAARASYARARCDRPPAARGQPHRARDRLARCGAARG